jgi:hypothetical protein
MCSDFLVMHPSGPFFVLSDDEYAAALKTYPNLDEDRTIQFEKNSASGSVTVGGDCYFNNETVISQFERLFKLLPFKQAYANHSFVCLVDNATTHTKAEFTLNDFGMKPGTRCPIDRIDYIDEINAIRSISCRTDDGTSKGLLAIAKELNITVPHGCSLNDLKTRLSSHRAFKTVRL